MKGGEKIMSDIKHVVKPDIEVEGFEIIDMEEKLDFAPKGCGCTKEGNGCNVEVKVPLF